MHPANTLTDGQMLYEAVVYCHLYVNLLVAAGKAQAQSVSELQIGGPPPYIIIIFKREEAVVHSLASNTVVHEIS